MAPRLDEPERVTSWLAGWVDYVFALTLMVGRWLRLPIVQPAPSGLLATAEGFSPQRPHAPRWNEPHKKSSTNLLVRIAEIAMVIVSFFLGAQLLSGTPTVAAPDLSKLTLTPDHQGVESRAVPSAAAKQILVPAEQTITVVPPTVETVAQADDEEAALLAPLPDDEASAASAPAATPVATVGAVAPTPEPTTADAALPIPTPPAPPAATEAPSRVNPDLPDRYLTSDEIAAAALEAGWAPEVIPDLQKVAWCESRYHTHAQYLGARGLMQILPFWFDAAGLDFSMWADPVTNLKAAKLVYDSHLRDFGDPWSAWTCKP
ncbi:MAG: lytic transglycosylase domain-containing protein [Dehalococcoidia bacterium]